MTSDTRSVIGLLLASFHGEQLIPIFIGILLLALGVLVASSMLLVRYFKRRIGRRAYWLVPVPWVVAVVSIFLVYWTERPNTGQPETLKGADIHRLITHLPKYIEFSFSGASFFDQRLYVGSNIGLVEISGGTVSQLFRFQPSDSVVSGPWLDRADHLLWVRDDHTSELANFDGKTWLRIKEPFSSRHDLSRGDALEGIKPIGTTDGFWLAAGGAVWRWNQTSRQWTLVSDVLDQPGDYQQINEIIGILPIHGSQLLIVRHEPLSFLVKAGQDFNSDEINRVGEAISQPLERGGESFLADTWAVTRDRGYICSKTQKLFEVANDRLAPLDAPGPCESVSVDEDWNLLASIRRKGIYRYAGGNWTLVAPSPYPSGAGEYWTHLCATSGQLAIALDAKPVIDREHSAGRDMRFKRDAPTGVWLFGKGSLTQVSF